MPLISVSYFMLVALSLIPERYFRYRIGFLHCTVRHHTMLNEESDDTWMFSESSDDEKDGLGKYS